MQPLDAINLCEAAYEAADTDTLDVCADSGRCIFRRIDGALVIACPGTDDVRSLLTDAEAWPHRSAELACDVHTGFWAAVSAMWPEVWARVQQHDGPIVLTGHSLGGALAILLGGLLCAIGRPPIEVMAFAPPRAVTGFALGHLLAGCGVIVALYRNGCDVVTELPIWLPGRPWAQPGPITHVGQADDPVGDHALARYRAAFETIAMVAV